jgi:hypothetical protein
MQTRNIPIIADSHYTTSKVHKDITESICRNAARFRMPAEIVHINKNGIDWDRLPPAVIVTPGSMTYLKKVISSLQQANKKILLAGLDSDSFGIDISCISPSRYFDTFRLIRYLQDCGRGRIALVGFRKDDITDSIRYPVAVNTINTFDKVHYADQSFFWNTDLAGCLEDFLKNAGKFNAAVCPNDPVAVHLVKACLDYGIRIPEDLYIAGFSIMRISSFVKPALTRIATDFSEIGSHALNILKYIVNNIESDIALKIHVPSKLILGESTENKPEKTPGNVFSSSDLCKVNRSRVRFLGNIMVKNTLQLEKCLNQRDALDLKIMDCLLKGLSYEAIAENLYISPSGIQYRVNKIYNDADVSSRAEFEDLVKKVLGSSNPFDGS